MVGDFSTEIFDPYGVLGPIFFFFSFLIFQIPSTCGILSSFAWKMTDKGPNIPNLILIE